jgi:hypothetical protein
MRWTCLAIFLLLACDRQPTVVEDAPATVSVTWSGKHEGRFAVPAEAAWCPVDTMVQVFAMRGDTGVGFTLYATDTIRPAQYPVLSPEVVVDWRPLGAAAVRWVGDVDMVGFQAISGVISVTSVDSGLTGTLDVGLRVPNGVDTIHLAGEF